MTEHQLILKDGTKVLFTWDAAEVVVPNIWHVEESRGKARVRGNEKVGRVYLHNAIAVHHGFSCAIPTNGDNTDCRTPNLTFSDNVKRVKPSNELLRVEAGVAYFRIGNNLEFTVDEADIPLVLQYRWWAKKSKTTNSLQHYVISSGEKIRLHRLLINPGDHEEVDHKDRNPLNNCRNNLRVSDRSQNQMNAVRDKTGSSSKFHGVGWDKSRSKWVARVTAYGKTPYFRRFSDEIEAAKAYDVAARKYHGEFAKLNFPEEGK